MRKLYSAIAMTGLVILTACNNDKPKTSEAATDKKSEEPATSTNTISKGENIISFTVNGEPVKSSGWAISRFDFGNGTGTCVNVTSNMHEQPKTINININGDQPGTYSLQSGLKTIKTPGVAYGSYTPDYMKDMGNHFSFKDGEFLIVSIDTVAGLLNAAFHGTAKNMKGETVTITDGKVINGKFKPGINRLH